MTLITNKALVLGLYPGNRSHLVTRVLPFFFDFISFFSAGRHEVGLTLQVVLSVAFMTA